MDQDGIKTWAEKVAADLIVGGERVPFDRVLSAHMATVNELRGQGLTWRSITNFLTRAGVRRKDKTPISPDQLRADFSRLSVRQMQPEMQPRKSAPRLSPKAVVRPENAAVQTLPSQATDISNGGTESTSIIKSEVTDKAVSSDDVIAALARIQKV